MPFNYGYDPEIDPSDTRIQGYTPPPVQQQPGRLRRYGQAMLQGGLPALAGEAMGNKQPQRRQYGAMGMMMNKLGFGG